MHEQPERHTLLPLQGYFFIPGQRFRELYYWDTFWVVKGLLVSQMPDSAEVSFICHWSKENCKNSSLPSEACMHTTSLACTHQRCAACHESHKSRSTNFDN